MDTVNPYSPPKSTVADAEDRINAGEKPRNVKIAMLLLWASFGLGLLGSVIKVVKGEYPPVLSLPVAIVIYSLAQLPAVWFNLQLGAGRNWARIVWLILFGVGALISVLAFRVVADSIKGDVMRLGIQTVMGLAITGLLLTPSAARWYKGEKRS
jgi:hypothetical protein